MSEALWLERMKNISVCNERCIDDADIVSTDGLEIGDFRRLLRVARAAVQAAKDCDVLADSYQSKHCPFTVGDVANDLREALRSEED